MNKKVFKRSTWGQWSSSAIPGWGMINDLSVVVSSTEGVEGNNKPNRSRVSSAATQAMTAVARESVVVPVLLSGKMPGRERGFGGNKIYTVADVHRFIEESRGEKLNISVDWTLTARAVEQVDHGDYRNRMIVTGWKPVFTNEKTLKGMVAYWRTVL
jgi:hypothetical protein